MLKLQIQITGTESQKQKMLQAIQSLEDILNSNLFKERVLAESYTVVKCTGMLWWKKCSHILVPGFTTTKDSPLTVYNKIMSGNGGADADGNTFLKGRWDCVSGGNGKVIGFTYAKDKDVNTYSWVLNSYKLYELTGHLGHELLHVYGWSHSSARDYDSVPYDVGYIIEQIGRDLNNDYR